MLADQERGARATATSPPMDSNLAVEKFLARRGGRGRGLSLSLPLFLSPFSRSCHTRNPYLVPGEIMIVPRANFPVGQRATPIHGRNTECERVLMLPVLGPGEFIVICNRGRSSFLAVRLSAALRGRRIHPFLYPPILFPCRSRTCVDPGISSGWARVKNR